MDDSPFPEVDSRFNTTVQEYIEIIRDLISERRVARVKDIAKLRGVTRSSVSTAMSMLRDLDLVDHEHYGYVSLTRDGISLGEILARRHSIIRQFLHKCLHIEADIADDEACKLEHSMSVQTLNALIRFVQIANECPACTGIKPVDDVK